MKIRLREYKMSDKEKDLSPRYYIAEGFIWVFGATLVVSWLIGLPPNQYLAIPTLNVPISSQYFPRIVWVLLFLALLYMVVEWKQSLRTVRHLTWNKIRAAFTGFWAIASSWIAYPLIVRDTRFSGISPGWYLGFITIGTVVGLLVSILAFSALMIRTPTESKRLRLSRVPVATRAQFIIWTPVVLLLITVYYILISYSPPVIHDVASFFVAIPFLWMIGEEVASLFLAHDENGEHIPYSKRIKQLKRILDSHDYGYILADQGDSVTDEHAFHTKDSPRAIQQAMQKKYSVNQAQEPINFHVQYLEEMQLQFFQKDGNSKNKDLQNRGVRVHKRHGKKESIRVLFIPTDSSHPKQELVISCCVVEKYAEKFIREHSDKPDMVHRIASYAINQAVIDTMVDQAGPMLHRFVESGQEEQVAKLIEQHADVNQVAEAGWTPLLYASAQGYPQIGRMLLDAGANPDIGNVQGITPLMYGARYGNSTICGLLLEYGATVDIQDIYGGTALIVASRECHEDVVKLLLDADANPTIKTKDGKTALDFAHERGNGQIAKMLRKTAKT